MKRHLDWICPNLEKVPINENCIHQGSNKSGRPTLSENPYSSMFPLSESPTNQESKVIQ